MSRAVIYETNGGPEVLELREVGDLTKEALACRGVLGEHPQRLDGHEPVMLEVTRQIHARHRAVPERTAGLVTPAEGDLQLL